MTAPESIDATECPSDQRLAAWLNDQLAPEEVEPIEAHLESCEACALRLDDLTTEPDSLVERLRDAAGLGGPGAAEPAQDPNLLFGALAMQAGLISAQQFADSCVLWASRSGVSLAELMVDQGWIDQAARQSVEALLAARSPRSTTNPSAETLAGHSATPIAVGETLSHTPLPTEHLRLKHLHSQGGIGQVWLAQDALLGREVALKELLPELRGSKKHRERFFREARVGAQLSHPGTAPVYEYREEAGRCYYTMKFYSGRTFTEAIREAHQTRGDAEDAAPWFDRFFPLLEQFLSVCDTIAYAHAQGIVHRDLKGDNIVLGEYGEVTVVDWGLAKAIPGAGAAASPARLVGESPTLEGERLGTPGFMAPEQARGEMAGIDERTDVYGLSAVLYELLTTRAPFSGETSNEVMHRVEVQPPAPPSLSHPDTPTQLEAICLRGLAKRKATRFASARDLSEAVRSWLTRQVDRQREAERQAKFFALSQDLFVAMDDRGMINHVNPAFLKFFNTTVEDSVGFHYLEDIHPDDQALVNRLFEQVLRGVSQYDTVIRVKDEEGVFRRVSWSLTRVPGEPTLYAVGRPIDEEGERRRATLARAEFFSLSPDLFVISDEQGRAGQVNEAWERVLGWKPEEVEGRPFIEFIHPDDVGRASRAGRKSLLRGPVSDLEMRLRHRDGGYRTIVWSLCRLHGDRINYAIGREVPGGATE
ncbi:Serine/threonine-protein kinase PknD [Planctomycetes bacterium MalM25]|nr:Serine/threonine-protein kinase PknD [Planctomycetes bacterium MalM25]